MLLIAQWTYITCGFAEKQTVSTFKGGGCEWPGTFITNRCCSGFTLGEPAIHEGRPLHQRVYGLIVKDFFTRQLIILCIDLIVSVGLILLTQKSSNLGLPDWLNAMVSTIKYPYVIGTASGLFFLPFIKRGTTWSAKNVFDQPEPFFNCWHRAKAKPQKV